MKLTGRLSWFLLAFGAWSWMVWVTFAKNLWADSAHQAFTNGDHSHPTAFFWIHLALTIVSFALGTAIGVIGLRGVLAARRATQ